jgi:hypothetical protein
MGCGGLPLPKFSSWNSLSGFQYSDEIRKREARMSKANNISTDADRTATYRRLGVVAVVIAVYVMVYLLMVDWKDSIVVEHQMREDWLLVHCEPNYASNQTVDSILFYAFSPVNWIDRTIRPNYWDYEEKKIY